MSKWLNESESVSILQNYLTKNGLKTWILAAQSFKAHIGQNLSKTVWFIDYLVVWTQKTCQMTVLHFIPE